MHPDRSETQKSLHSKLAFTLPSRLVTKTEAKGLYTHNCYMAHLLVIFSQKLGSTTQNYLLEAIFCSEQQPDRYSLRLSGASLVSSSLLRADDSFPQFLFEIALLNTAFASLAVRQEQFSQLLHAKLREIVVRSQRRRCRATRHDT